MGGAGRAARAQAVAPDRPWHESTSVCYRKVKRVKVFGARAVFFARPRPIPVRSSPFWCAAEVRQVRGVADRRTGRVRNDYSIVKERLVRGVGPAGRESAALPRDPCPVAQGEWARAQDSEPIAERRNRRSGLRASPEGEQGSRREEKSTLRDFRFEDLRVHKRMARRG